MPPEPSRPAAKKRVPRKYTEEELKDIEVKRLKGELSCAECRRLKLKCDKKVPCGSCVRRGCESICPCGVLSAGQGTRFILASTDQLHSKIGEMSHRIRQLEDALAILQATVSDQRHPLLSDEMLKVKFGSEVISSRYEALEAEGEEGEISHSIDALGTLTLGDSGEVKYFGRSAGSETLMMAEDDDDDEEIEEGDKTYPSVGPMLENLGSLFPFPDQPKSTTEIIRVLKTHLPPKERAATLCESYLVHASNFFRPIKKEELGETFVPRIYASAFSTPNAMVNGDSTPANGEDEEGTSPHSLATLYFVFALGALLDLNLPPYNSEAERYYELARAALSLKVVFDSPQVDTVQALGLMATYHMLAGKKYSRDSAWCIMGIAAKLAQCIGLHRDSARWHMDPKTVQKRRTLFWEVYAADMSNSLAIGRPPAIHLSYVDCEFPTDEEASLNDEEEIQHGFWRMKYIFARDMFLGVADATLTAKSLNYASVLELDRKVREFSFPSSVKPYALKEEVGDEVYHSSSLSLQGFYASQYRTVTMLYLHRSFFAQALLDRPANPLLSPFAPSFLTAYRCASVIIKASAHQFDRCAEMARRVWFLLYHMFSAAIIVGTVVTRSPNSNVAANALEDLERAIELFEQTAPVSHRAKVALGVLKKLQDKALRAYKQYKSRANSQGPESSKATSDPASSPQSSTTDDSDELAIFGGQTRVLAKKKTRRQKSMGSMSMVTDSPSPPNATSPVSPPQMATSISAESATSPTRTFARASSFTSDSGAAPGLSGGARMEEMSAQSGDPFSPGAFPGDYAALGIASPERATSNEPPDNIIQLTPSNNNANASNTKSSLNLEAYTTPLPEQSQLDAFYPNVPNAAGPSAPAAGLVPSPESFFRALDASQPAFTSPPPATSNFPASLLPSDPWRPYSPDVNGLPKADTSFGWMPPSNRQAPLPSFMGQYQANSLATGNMQPAASSSVDAIMSNLFTGRSSSQAAPNTTFANQTLSPLSFLTQNIGPSDSTSMGLNFGAPGQEAGAMGDPAAMMVELGLMTESTMDSGWFNFMQDCGIVVDGAPGRQNNTNVNGDMNGQP